MNQLWIFPIVLVVILVGTMFALWMVMYAKVVQDTAKLTTGISMSAMRGRIRENNCKPNQKCLLVTGDSLAAGVGSKGGESVSHWLRKMLPTVNVDTEAQPGYRVLDVYEQLLTNQNRYDAIVVFAGSNDRVFFDKTPLQQFQQDLIRLYERCCDMLKPQGRVYVMNVCDPLRIPIMSLSTTPEHTIAVINQLEKTINDTTLIVCKNKDCQVSSVSLRNVITRPSYFAMDGVHMSGLGYQAIASYLFETHLKRDGIS